MMGLSPTRPCILYARPLVVQLPASFPLASKPIMPMVSWFSTLMMGLYWLVTFHLSYSFCAFGLNFSASRGKPSAIANCRAPSPTSMTCGVFSITARAREMGCFTCLTKATVPQEPSPRMMEASKVVIPSRSGSPCRPTERLSMSNSVLRTPASTASRMSPVFWSMAQASALAGRPWFQVDSRIGLVPAFFLVGT